MLRQKDNFLESCRSRFAYLPIFFLPHDSVEVILVSKYVMAIVLSILRFSIGRPLILIAGVDLRLVSSLGNVLVLGE